MALLIAGGDGWAIVSILIYCASFLVLRIYFLRKERRWFAPVTVWSCAVIFGAALAAVQVLPWYYYLRQTVPVNTAANASTPLDPISLLFPMTVIGTDAQVLPTSCSALYFGAVPLVLAVLWLALRHHVPRLYKRRFDILFALNTTMVLAAVAISYFPPARMAGIYPQYFLLFHALGWSLAGAAAAEAWLELDPNQCNSTLRRLAFFVPFAITLAGAGIYWRAGEFGSGTPSMISLSVIGGVTGATLVLLAVTLLRPSALLLGFGLSALVIGNLWWATAPAITYTSDDEFSAFRAAKDDAVVRRIDGDAPRMLRRFAQFQERAHGDPFAMSRLSEGWLLLDKQALQDTYAGLRPDLHLHSVYSQGAALFRVEGAPGRASIIFSDKPSAVLAAPKIETDSLPEMVGTDPRARAEVVASGNAELVIESRSESPGILVLADAFYPGWQAEVDGSPTSLWPVDTLMRGVYVPEGQHTVQVEYVSSIFERGRSISLAAMGLLILGELNLLRLWYRRRSALAVPQN